MDPDEFNFEDFLEQQIVIPAQALIKHVTSDTDYQFVDYKKREGDLMDNYIKFNKLTQQHIDVFNQYIDNLANIITSKELDMKDGRIVKFVNLRCGKPTYKEHYREHQLMPHMARLRGLSYDAAVTADLVVTTKGEVIYTSKNPIVIFRTPIMLGSKRCYLENKTAIELIKLGEDTVEQGGYFIIEGVEKIIMLEEKLSTNRFFIMAAPSKETKFKTVMKLTTNTPTGTKLNELVFTNEHVMKYSFQQLRKKNKKKGEKFEKTKKMNVVYVFQLFSIYYFNGTFCYTQKEIYDLITPFLRSKNSLKHFHNTFAVTQAMNLGKSSPVTAHDVIWKKMYELKGLSDNEKHEKTKEQLITIMEHYEFIDPYNEEINKDFKIRIVTLKIQLLAMMIAHYLDYLEGIVSMDDRDDWANKRVEGPGRKMESQIRSSWNKVLRKVEDGFLRENMKVEEIEKTFHGKEVGETITKFFRDAFVNSKWGIKGDQQKNNATQTLNRDNPFATLSHINTINVNIQRTDKNVAIRMVQSSQYGYVCYVKASEGSNCGLVKNLANTTRLSMDRGSLGERVLMPILVLTNTKTLTTPHMLMLNGKLMGWCNGPETRERVIAARRQKEIFFDTSVYLDKRTLWIDGSPSRLLRPVLVVDETTQELVLDIKNIKKYTPEHLILEGAMEYISALEEKNLKIAIDVQDLEKHRRQRADVEAQLLETNEIDEDLRRLMEHRPYTHCEISGRAALGVAADMIPFMERNMAPRNIYQSSMGTQAVSVYHLNYKGRFDSNIKVLESPNPPIVRTALGDTLGVTQRGLGQNVMVAMMAYPGNEEDSFIFNQGSIDLGMFRQVKYFTMTGKIKVAGQSEKTSYFKRPTPKQGEDPKIYEHLNAQGLPFIGAYLKGKQCVIGILENSQGREYNKSVYLNDDDEGLVEDILLQSNMKEEIVIVKLRTTRIPKLGHKYAARMAQKGTAGLILPRSEMPFEEATGISPDVIVNTTVIPSRMTVSYLMEIIAGQAAALYGQTVDASAFQEATVDTWEDMLLHAGYKKSTKRFRLGVTGELVDADIYMGVVHLQVLKQQPEDKISARSVGLKDVKTQQPTKGRTRGKGLKFGGMEVDSLFSHGASAAVNERTCNVSDKYVKAVCVDCGINAVFNVTTSAYECPKCNKMNVGSLTIPYVANYRAYLLQAMGIKESYVFKKLIKEVEVNEANEVEEVESEEECADEECVPYDLGQASEESEDDDSTVEVGDEVSEDESGEYEPEVDQDMYGED